MYVGGKLEIRQEQRLAEERAKRAQMMEGLERRRQILHRRKEKIEVLLPARACAGGH